MSSIQFDQIGYWSEVKLDIVRGYAQAYSQILAAHRLPNGGSLRHVYVDGFVRSGARLSLAGWFSPSALAPAGFVGRSVTCGGCPA